MKDTEISDVLDRCTESRGYLIFGAFLTQKKDRSGFPIIDFEYRRHHFSLEDSRQAILQLKAFVDDELKKFVSDNNGQDGY